MGPTNDFVEKTLGFLGTYNVDLSYSIKVKKPVMEFWFLVRRRRGIRKAQWEKISESHWAHNDRAEHGGKEREMRKGSNFVFFPLHYCGLYAFPRRICDYLYVIYFILLLLYMVYYFYVFLFLFVVVCFLIFVLLIIFFCFVFCVLFVCFCFFVFLFLFFVVVCFMVYY